jgi:flagellar motility protein MotE (MotC chaperone)
MTAAPLIRPALPVLVSLWLSLASAPASTKETGAEDLRKIIEEYCLAVSDAAAEQRMATQTAVLQALEAKVEERIGRLERQKIELESLLQRRDELRNLAKKELVDIYSGMDPEAASQQMAQLDLVLASSVLRQLKPRQASAILNEMKPDLAAGLARMIAASAQTGKEAQ